MTGLVLLFMFSAVVANRFSSGADSESPRVDEKSDILASPSGENHRSTPMSEPPGVPQNSEVEPGWRAYGVTHDYRPIGYTKASEFWSVENGGAVAVYDEPEGAIIGYATHYVPLIPASDYEAQGFDLETYSRATIGDAKYDDIAHQLGTGSAP